MQRYTFILLRNTIRFGSSETPKVQKIIQILLKANSNDSKYPLYPIHEKHQTTNTLKSLRPKNFKACTKRFFKNAAHDWVAFLL